MLITGVSSMTKGGCFMGCSPSHKVPLFFLCLFLIVHYDVVHAVAYQPECDSWDEVIAAIDQQLQSIPTSSSSCTKRDDCTRLECQLQLFGNDFTLDMKIFNCEVPPQMRILITGVGVHLEETVTHGSTYEIPGLTYSIPLLGTVGLQLVVSFQEKANGIQLGLSLRTKSTPSFDVTLFDGILIHVPPCPQDGGMTAACQEMADFAEHVQAPPGFSCAARTQCDGLECDGSFRPDLAISINIDVTASLVIDSCHNPISEVISAKSKVLNLDWEHRFTHSESVLVDDSLPLGTTLNVTVMMIPSEDLQVMYSTVIFTICQSSGGCQEETFLNNASVPIPPCNVRPTTSVTATPPIHSEGECASWSEIEMLLKASLSPSDECSTLPDCSGYNCSATVNGDKYEIIFEELHCQDPVYVHVAIRKINGSYHDSWNFTHNDSVVLEESGNLKVMLRVIVQKLSPSTLFLGGYIDGVYGEEVSSFPIVPEQIVEVTPCGDSNVSTTTFEMVTTVLKEDKGWTKKTEAPGKNNHRKSSSTNKPNIIPVPASGVGTGVFVGIAVLLVAVIVATLLIAAFMMYRRQHSNGSDFLLEDTVSVDGSMLKQV